jgi:hypothetical protein
MKSWFLFMALIWGLVGISLAQDKPFPDAIPTKFFMQIGGGLDYRDSVELKNGVVTFQRKEAGRVLSEKSFHLSPDKAAWTRFIQEINTAKLYRWSKIYSNPGVDDGCQWSIDLEIDGRKIHSEGNNSYPTDGDELKPTTSFPANSPPFDRLCQAVSHLIGQEFR